MTSLLKTNHAVSDWYLKASLFWSQSRKALISDPSRLSTDKSLHLEKLCFCWPLEQVWFSLFCQSPGSLAVERTAFSRWLSCFWQGSELVFGPGVVQAKRPLLLSLGRPLGRQSPVPAAFQLDPPRPAKHECKLSILIRVKEDF